MKTRQVIFTAEAEDDLANIYNDIADQGAPLAAFGFCGRIGTFCRSLSHAAERGTDLGSHREGVRAVGFERRATIVFHVSGETVSILRIHRAGRNWMDDLK